MIPHHVPQFVLPASFDADVLIPDSLRLYRDDARYFASTILRKTARRQTDHNGYVFLRAEHLRNVMSFHRYADVVNTLLDSGTVHRTPYQVGKCPFAYRLDDRFRDDRHIRWPVQNARLLRRMAKFGAKARLQAQQRMLPVHDALAKQQRRLEIDGELAREIIGHLPPESNPFDVQGILVADIEEQRFRLSVGRYGRVANSITNMKREVRCALRYKGRPLAGVDISCAQPSLLALLMGTICSQQGGKKLTSYNACTRIPSLFLPPGLVQAPAVPVPFLPWSDRTDRTEKTEKTAPSFCLCPSVARFAEVCRAGELFSLLGSRLCASGYPLQRAEIKKRFLADVLAKRKASASGAEYPSPVEDAFREEFPGVWRFIRAVNQDGWEHWRLIRILQRLESWLVIEQVCQRFTTVFPKEFIITLHDAVYVRPKAVERLVDVFEEVFDELAFHMTLKRE